MPEQRIWVRTVAFSGSREPTGWMQSRTAELLDALDSRTRVVVGGCVGIDALIARLAYGRGLWVHAVIPADRRFVDPEWRRYCDSAEEMPRDSDYRARNLRMVELCDELIAIVPGPERDHPRSGTWMTIRLARGLRRPAQIHMEGP